MSVAKIIIAIEETGCIVKNKLITHDQGHTLKNVVCIAHQVAVTPWGVHHTN